ncbi:MAG: cupin domain-containing protein [Anaerolineaceae bacterium]|nr:cupin domain-containing protein [Anaerolineaceae bacterium]
MSNSLIHPQILSTDPDRTILFGNGLVQIMLNSEEIACGKFILQEGAEGSTDIHEQAVEIALIMKGKVEYNILGETFLVNPGQALLIPPKYPHDVRNVGAGEAVIFWMFMPNDHQSSQEVNP